jgi:hypothetical protein
MDKINAAKFEKSLLKFIEANLKSAYTPLEDIYLEG